MTFGRTARHARIWMEEFHAVLPSYTWIALHILGFCIMVFVLVNVVRECRGAERIYFVMFLGSLLIEPLRRLAMTVAMIALYAQAAAALVMLLASAWLLITVKPPADASESQLPS